VDLLSLLLKYFPLVAMAVFAVSFFSRPYEERGPVDLLSPAGHNLELSSGGEPEPVTVPGEYKDFESPFLFEFPLVSALL
jgi:hypothetical protein